MLMVIYMEMSSDYLWRVILLGLPLCKDVKILNYILDLTGRIILRRHWGIVLVRRYNTPI